ncbi:MAG: hypothetical protein PHH59_11745, partial [Methylovulum sp.]|nr:hypothetical protein [Methylovulum sp.]
MTTFLMSAVRLGINLLCNRTPFDPFALGAGRCCHRNLLGLVLFPHIGVKPITDIKPPELLAVLRKIEARNAIDTAHKAFSVARYSVMPWLQAAPSGI